MAHDRGVGEDIDEGLPSRTPRRSRLLLLPAGVAVLAAVVVAAALALTGGDEERPVAVLVGTDEPDQPTATPEPEGPRLGVIAVEPAPPGSPVLVAVAADAVAGTVALTFDRPVQPGTDGFGAMALFVHGGDPACPGGGGNGQRFLSGAGTLTVEMEASYLRPGVSYITMIPGVVTAVDGGQPNAAVGCTAVDAGAPTPPGVVGVVATAGVDGSGTVEVAFDREVRLGDPAAVTVHRDAACLDPLGRGTAFEGDPVVGPGAAAGTALEVKVTVAVSAVEAGTVYVGVGPGVVREPVADHPNAPAPCTAVTATRPPVFVSATGAPGRLTVRFDLPVVGGRDGLTAMYLVVFGSDPTCATPAGNAHEYLAGEGTDTITVEASSVEVGTTYISIVPGFVASAQDGTPNRPVRCVAVPVAA